MGTEQSSPTDIQKFWSSTDLTLITVPGHPTLVQSISSPSVYAQKYMIQMGSKNQVQQIVILRERKIARQNIVNVYDFQIKKGLFGCARNVDNYDIVTERIPFRLAQFQNLGQKQLLYIFHESLNGFKEIYKYGRLCLPNSQMIGIKQNGQIKVWTNQNWSDNKFRMAASEAQSIQFLWSCIKTCGADSHALWNFNLNFYRLNPNSFQNVLNMIRNLHSKQIIQGRVRLENIVRTKALKLPINIPNSLTTQMQMPMVMNTGTGFLNMPVYQQQVHYKVPNSQQMKQTPKIMYIGAKNTPPMRNNTVQNQLGIRPRAFSQQVRKNNNGFNQFNIHQQNLMIQAKLMSLPQPNPVSFISQAHQPISQQNNTQYYHQNHNIGLAPPTFLSKPQSVITQPLHHQNFETNAALHLSNAGNMNINMIKNPTNTLNTDANSHSFNLNKNDIRTTNTTVTMNSINVDNMINKANTPANVKVSLNPSTIHKKNTSNTQATDINKYKEIHSIEQMKTHEKQPHLSFPVSIPTQKPKSTYRYCPHRVQTPTQLTHNTSPNTNATTNRNKSANFNPGTNYVTIGNMNIKINKNDYISQTKTLGAPKISINNGSNLGVQQKNSQLRQQSNQLNQNASKSLQNKNRSFWMVSKEKQRQRKYSPNITYTYYKHSNQDQSKNDKIQNKYEKYDSKTTDQHKHPPTNIIANVHLHTSNAHNVNLLKSNANNNTLHLHTSNVHNNVNIPTFNDYSYLVNGVNPKLKSPDNQLIPNIQGISKGINVNVQNRPKSHRIDDKQQQQQSQNYWNPYTTRPSNNQIRATNKGNQSSPHGSVHNHKVNLNSLLSNIYTAKTVSASAPKTVSVPAPVPASVSASTSITVAPLNTAAQTSTNSVSVSNKSVAINTQNPNSSTNKNEQNTSHNENQANKSKNKGKNSSPKNSKQKRQIVSQYQIQYKCSKSSNDASENRVNSNTTHAAKTKKQVQSQSQYNKPNFSQVDSQHVYHSSYNSPVYNFNPNYNYNYNTSNNQSGTSTVQNYLSSYRNSQFVPHNLQQAVANKTKASHNSNRNDSVNIDTNDKTTGKLTSDQGNNYSNKIGRNSAQNLDKPLNNSSNNSKYNSKTMINKTGASSARTNPNKNNQHIQHIQHIQNHQPPINVNVSANEIELNLDLQNIGKHKQRYNSHTERPSYEANPNQPKTLHKHQQNMANTQPFPQHRMQHLQKSVQLQTSSRPTMAINQVELENRLQWVTQNKLEQIRTLGKDYSEYQANEILDARKIDRSEGNGVNISEIEISNKIDIVMNAYEYKLQYEVEYESNFNESVEHQADHPNYNPRQVNQDFHYHMHQEFEQQKTVSYDNRSNSYDANSHYYFKPSEEYQSQSQQHTQQHQFKHQLHLQAKWEKQNDQMRAQNSIYPQSNEPKTEIKQQYTSQHVSIYNSPHLFQRLSQNITNKQQNQQQYQGYSADSDSRKVAQQFKYLLRSIEKSPRTSSNHNDSNNSSPSKDFARQDFNDELDQADTLKQKKKVYHVNIANDNNRRALISKFDQYEKYQKQLQQYEKRHQNRVNNYKNQHHLTDQLDLQLELQERQRKNIHLLSDPTAIPQRWEQEESLSQNL